MLAIKVGLVDTTGEISTATMAAAAAALNIQVTRDLPQFWSVSATVSYLPDPHKIPQGYWPVQLVKELPPPEGGFHLTKHNQPYAKVIASSENDDWTIDASHEIIEMLIDPNGNKLQASTAIRIVADGVEDTTGEFEYLVEACDPCEANDFAYQINTISVSDFLTPHFYDLQPTPGTRYSFNGKITRPRELLKGGYISYVDPADDHVKQILWVDEGSPQPKDLGSAAGGSLRLLVEEHTHHLVRAKRAPLTGKALDLRHTNRQHWDEAAKKRAKHYV
jgi:hypothetical protein